MKYTIGIDIGGTNTDGVLVDDNQKIILQKKTLTQENIEEGFCEVVEAIVNKDIESVIVGTTHALNAILEKKNLYRVGVIRIAGHFFDTLPPCFDWEEELKKEVFVAVETVNGGFECDGRRISPFNEKETLNAIKRLLKKGAEALAIVSVFSPIYNEDEKRVALLVKKLKGKDFPISLSSEVGKIGFIERENGSILNSALKKSLGVGFRKLAEKLLDLNIRAPLFLTQNDGSIIDLDKAIEYPILTISSGPTNSFAGASFLASQKECVIVDIGGTSTDVGIVKNGFVRRSRHNFKIENIELNFSMPDLMSTGIGGGSYIDLEKETIGPKSSGRKLFEEALFAGGDRLTLTDLALVLDDSLFPTAKKVNIDKKSAEKILSKALNKIRDLILEMKGKEELPVLLVGGGAILFKNVNFSEKFVIPPHFDVANAYGAALAQISASTDTTISLKDRDRTLDRLKMETIKKSIEKGADPLDAKVVDVQIMPYHYLPNALARVVVTVLGKKNPLTYKGKIL